MMTGSLLARGRALTRRARGATVTASVATAIAAGIGGCSAAATTPSVTSTTLRIYVSVPPGGADPAQQDVLDAERLAFQQAGDKVDKFTIKLVTAQGKEISDNARSAIEDTTTIAYIGELQPAASADSIGINNAEDVLQVTPTDTALELTQSTPAIPGSPDRYYESLSTYGRTFARVVPTDGLEAKALIGEMEALGVKTLYVSGDDSEYGRALALAITNYAYPGITVVHAESSAGAVFYAGSSASAAASAFNAVASGNPSVKLFAPSALADDSFTTALSPAAQRSTVVSSPGFTPADLTPAGKQFVADFKAAYGHAPATEAIFGYEAMAAVMAVLHEAKASADNRGTVVSDFFHIKNRSSVLGTYSINSNGDTNIAPFVFNHVRAGTLVPFKAVQEQG